METIIKEVWREHPLYKQGKVELLPTDWVWKYYGRDVTPEVDLLDGKIVSMDKLWENMLEVGLHNPLIIRVGLKNRKFRLEAGNHRIQVFHQHGVLFVPVTVQVHEVCSPSEKDAMTNATYNFDLPDGLLISEITDEYMAPSQVFPPSFLK
jgi:hypothetical protein